MRPNPETVLKTDERINDDQRYFQNLGDLDTGRKQTGQTHPMLRPNEIIRVSAIRTPFLPPLWQERGVRLSYCKNIGVGI